MAKNQFPTNREATNAHLCRFMSVRLLSIESQKLLEKIIWNVENLQPLILYPDANIVKSALILL